MRLFWAIVPPPAVVDGIAEAAQPLRQRWPDLRWPAADGWHLTLAFLGTVRAEVVPGLVQAVEGALAGTAGPVPVVLHPRAEAITAGVVWLPAEPTAPLAGLAAAVQAACAPIAAADDRHSFRGHLTIARLPRRQRAGRAALGREVAAAYEGPAVTWTVSEVMLLSSRTTAAGTTYETVAAVALPTS